MILSKTPLRISFFSGGSDMPNFYEKEYGAALSVTIDKFIYVMIHKTPHMGIKIMYDTIEEFPDVEHMQHAITRESLKLFDVKSEYTISSIADILSKGSGLGSSSAFTVGLINCLAHRDQEQRYTLLTREYLAQTAYKVEREMCNYPVGKQDQYASAYGGINLFKFNSDDSVEITPLFYDRSLWNNLQDRLLLVYSGRGRNANSILQKQAAAMNEQEKFDLVKRSRDKAFIGAKMLSDNKLDDFGVLLHEAWKDKKAVEKSISNEYFDDIYSRALKAGALGGKLLGAGGGGFFLFYVPPTKRQNVIKDITDGTTCKVYDFRFTDYGSRLTSSC
jgi:D-glycero-alpha-D-manno-heptose-7-phosphate kinase